MERSIRNVPGIARAMRGILGAAALAMAGSVAATPLWAGEPIRQVNVIETAVKLAPRRPLIAHVRFCLFYADQCVVRGDRRDPARSAADHFNEALQVNWAVNRAITPRPDEGFDSWDVDVTEGDCEDYALQKRKDLIALGWPTSALRIAIARTTDGLYHAVLLVEIGGVDYALDNLTSRVLPWSKTPYTFLMLQDRADPRAWHTVTHELRYARAN